MRLRDVELRRYCQFVDQRLKVHPQVTVIVGKNDTGKSIFLDRFFDQYVYEGGSHSADRPRMPDFRGDKISFSLSWEVCEDDYHDFPLTEAFGPNHIGRIQVDFAEDSPNGKRWTFRADGRLANAYEGETPEGIPILKKCFRSRYLFPRPHCIGPRHGLILRSIFEARFIRQPKTGGIYPKLNSSEEALLRLAGIWAETREELDLNKPWPFEGMIQRAELTLAEIDERLKEVSQKVTTELQQWWKDPAGLIFKARLAGGSSGKEFSHKTNRFSVEWEVSDESGTRFHGTGLQWFVTLIVQLLLIDIEKKPVLFLLDEPAVNLHPGAQRLLAKLLDARSERVQIIYTTHSPFMMDWNFPQRLRVFHRDYVTKRTIIDNKPYSPKSLIHQIWDPLKSNIGITMGDIAVIGEQNFFVEGITDQIFLANSSVYLRSRRQAHLDLERASIIPYGEEAFLRSLVGLARSRGAKVVVIADSDTQGNKVRNYCVREGISCVQLKEFADRSLGDCSIEDVFGVEEYLKWVNAFYRDFEWFEALDSKIVQGDLGEKSLGAYLENLFKDRFGQAFSKISIAVLLVENMSALPEGVLKRLQALLEVLVSRI
jgi:hypothetical protein